MHYTVNEAAKILKLHPGTVRNKISKGEIKSIKVGKGVRITKNQLEEYAGIELDMEG